MSVVFLPLWLKMSCNQGSIFGTGTNGAYLEKVDNIKKLGDSPTRKNGGFMVVNTEWGAFNNTVCVFALCSRLVFLT